jgi:hypothetical protein
MPPASRFGKQIAEATAALNAAGVRFALIGGLALASHKVVRATQDVDLLVDAEKADEIETRLTKLGYRCLHRSADAANYARGDERLDFLYAQRPIARQLLAGAVELQTALGKLRVVSAEGLIGFKLQALVNDPQRTQDLEDIRALLRANRSALDMEQVRSYFNASRCSMSSYEKSAEAPFAAAAGVSEPARNDEDPYRTLDDLMVVVEALCPVWPSRGCFVDGGKLLF